MGFGGEANGDYETSGKRRCYGAKRGALFFVRGIMWQGQYLEVSSGTVDFKCGFLYPLEGSNCTHILSVTSALSDFSSDGVSKLRKA